MLSTLLWQYLKTRHQMGIKSRARLHALQAKKWRTLEKNVLNRAPFYRDYLGKPFTDYPIINKHVMMSHFDEINTVGMCKEQALELAGRAELSRDFSPMLGGVSVGLSSGTSGTRGLFIASKKERARWAGTLLAKALPRGLLARERVAFFLRADNRLYQTLNKSQGIECRFFDLKDDFEQQISQLNHYQPSILSAPASVLFELAKACLDGALKIAPIKIFSVAEVLDTTWKCVIEEAFELPVDEIYQCTEGFLGISQQDSLVRLNEEFLIIEKEWLDESRFIPIITDLMRESQPIIRYRLDDVLVIEKNQGPYTTLKAIEGRESDICYGVTKAHQLTPLFADSMRQIMAGLPIHFDHYQIRQKGCRQFSIAITPGIEPCAREDVIKALNHLFEKKDCQLPNWQWRAYEPPAQGMKQQLICNDWEKSS